MLVALINQTTHKIGPRMLDHDLGQDTVKLVGPRMDEGTLHHGLGLQDSRDLHSDVGEKR